MFGGVTCCFSMYYIRAPKILGCCPCKSRALIWDCRYPSLHHHGIVHQDLKCAFLSLVTYLRTSSTAPATPAAISLTLACNPHPFFILDSPLIIFSQSKTYSSFDKEVPRAYINETPADCSLSGQLSPCSPLWPPPFSCRQHHHLFPTKRRPQTEFQSHDQAESFIRHLATLDPLHSPTAQIALRDPHHHQHAIACRSLHILRPNWSPTVIVPGLGSGLLTFSAAVSRSSTQGWQMARSRSESTRRHTRAVGVGRREG